MARPAHRRRGFTLVELLLVLIVLSVVAALTMPLLARSSRGRALGGEATRFLAAIEYARDEARSQGVPMVVWFDQGGLTLGVEPRSGYDASVERSRTFALSPDIHAELTGAKSYNNNALEAAEFAPDGALDLASVASVKFVDQKGDDVTVARTTDNWGYEIPKQP